MNCMHESGWRRPFDVTDDRAALAVFTRTAPQCDPNFGARTPLRLTNACGKNAD
jgi:hypothetical protein